MIKNLFKRKKLPETQQVQHKDIQNLSPREGTAEFELLIAQTELDSGTNLPHGAQHLSYLLSYDPANLQWLDLARQYAQKADKPIDEHLLPIDGTQRYYATEALRAWFWHFEGRLHEAIELLIQITRAKPTPRYLDTWVLEWLERENALESLPLILPSIYLPLC